MTKRIQLTILGIITIVLLLVAGCVTPPSGKTSSEPAGNYQTTTAPTSQITTAPVYVTEVTPFMTSVTEENRSSDYRLYMTPTPYPEDLSCLIYINTQSYSYNTTAITFDLKNPPMYINYTVKPTNVTVNKVIPVRYGSDEVKTISFSDYAPYSWFDITVRNKETGEILLQDGFGKAKGYGIYTGATLKPILSSKNLQIEMRGNSITATTGIWVKPPGNIDDAGNKTFTECKFWVRPQNALKMATATTTPTWTPENQVTQ